MKHFNFTKIVCTVIFLWLVLMAIILLAIAAQAEVYQWNGTQRAYWAGTKPVQLVIDTEFSDEVIDRVMKILEPYPFVLKERKNIDLAYDPAVNEVALAYLDLHFNTGGSNVDPAYRNANGGLTRGLCHAGRASSDERLVWTIIHELFHSVGLDHGLPWKIAEGIIYPRPLMTSSKPAFKIQHDDIRALSETFKEKFLSNTITITGNIAGEPIKSMFLNFVNVDNVRDSSQIVVNHAFTNKTTYSIPNLKKGKYYITLSPIGLNAGVINVYDTPTYKTIKYWKGKRIVNLKEDRILNLEF